MVETDTIFALSSGPPPAGLAVVRLTGAQAPAALRALTGGRTPQPRRAAVMALADPETNTALDRALVLFFEAPESLTAEDVVELHLHGGLAVVAGVLDALGRMEGLRLAEPGEFTRRAFEAGKMDLTEAEAIADLVHAETEQQRRQAIRQMDGALHILYDGWRQRLLAALANAEAAIDFADEGDVGQNVFDAARIEAGQLYNEISDHLNDDHAGERIRSGVRVAIIGAPNAGKSSLLNALAKRDVAIVSETAGTTRDVIEVHLDLGGYALTVADTAGLRAGGDDIEREGMRRALLRAEDADLRLCVFDGALWPDLDGETERLIGEDAVVVLNKSDIKTLDDKIRIAGHTALALSAKTGAGLDRLIAALTEKTAALCAAGAGGAAPVTRARHRAGLERCLAALGRAGDGALSEDLCAEELRHAAHGLGAIIGVIGVEDVLDKIFADFCIGK